MLRIKIGVRYFPIISTILFGLALRKYVTAKNTAVTAKETNHEYSLGT